MKERRETEEQARTGTLGSQETYIIEPTKAREPSTCPPPQGKVLRPSEIVSGAVLG